MSSRVKSGDDEPITRRLDIAPCQVNAVVLQSWTSSKVGCDVATFPNQFSFANAVALQNATIATVGAKISTNEAVNWLNLSTSQNVCLNAVFSFVLAAQ